MLDTLAITPSIGDRRNPAARQTLLQRVSAEFQEMPCMRLTASQARRLFGLRPDVCERILATLVRQATLACDGERYRYNDARSWPFSHLAEAHAGVRLRAS
jgi:hypothetical protein